MRRFIALFAAVILLVGCAVPALAAGFGISPAEVAFEVSADASTRVEFIVYDFTGNLGISLENIPLRVEPTTVPVTASATGTRISLTFYGDKSLGSKIYQGKIRFLAMTGGMVAMGIKVKATVTNLVKGQTPVLATPEESQPAPEEAPAPPEESPAPTGASDIRGVVVMPAPETPAPTPPAPETPVPTLLYPPAPSRTTGLPILPLAGIAAGAAIVITLIVVLVRRRQY